MVRANLSSIFRRFWKPAVVTGAGGTAAAIWFEEILLYAEEILALIFLPILAGVIYVFNFIVFNSHKPRRENYQIYPKRGKKE